MLNFFFSHNSIPFRTRLALTIGLCTIGFVIVGSSLAAGIMWQWLFAEQRIAWEQDIAETGRILSRLVEQVDYAVVNDMIEAIVQNERVCSISVTSQSGYVIAEAAKAMPNSNALNCHIFQQTLFSGINPVSLLGHLKVSVTLFQVPPNWLKLLAAAGLAIILSSCLFALFIYRVLQHDISRPLSVLANRFVHFEPGEPNRLVLPATSAYEIQQLWDKFSAMERRITHQATTDWLTQLGNRYILEQTLNQAAARVSGQAIMLALIDLDNFKQINDYYGHLSGDELLKRAGQRIRNSLPDTAVVSRTGGDEYALILFYQPEKTATPENAVNQILAAFKQPFNIGHSLRFSITASIGSACFPSDVNTIDELWQAADLALHQAKANGRNSVCRYQRDFKGALHEQIRIAEGVRDAFSYNQVAFKFQPIIRLSDKKLWGFEMLLRLRDQEGRVIAAEHALKTTKQIGLTADLTRATVGSVKRHLPELSRSSSQKINLTLNLSRSQLLLTDAVNVVAQLSELSHQINFIIEITEEDILEDERVIINLQQLHQHGFAIALDDFGSGYSSLKCLHTLPLSIVKLDKALLPHDFSDTEACTLFSSTVKLIDKLGLAIIAEGIESNRECVFVENLGCQLGQGYYFGRPQNQPDYPGGLA